MFCDTQCCLDKCENKGELPINHSRYHLICKDHLNSIIHQALIICCYCGTQCKVVQTIVSQKPLCAICNVNKTHNEYSNLCLDCDKTEDWTCFHNPDRDPSPLIEPEAQQDLVEDAEKADKKRLKLKSSPHIRIKQGKNEKPSKNFNSQQKFIKFQKSSLKIIKNCSDSKGELQELNNPKCNSKICPEFPCKNSSCKRCNLYSTSKIVLTCAKCGKSNISNSSSCEHCFCKECFTQMNQTCQICFPRVQKCNSCSRNGFEKILFDCKHLGCTNCFKNVMCFECIFLKRIAKPKPYIKYACNKCDTMSETGFVLMCNHFICMKCRKSDWNFLNYRCQKCLLTDSGNSICFNCKEVFRFYSDQKIIL